MVARNGQVPRCARLADWEARMYAPVRNGRESELWPTLLFIPAVRYFLLLAPVCAPTVPLGLGKPHSWNTASVHGVVVVLSAS